MTINPHGGKNAGGGPIHIAEEGGSLGPKGREIPWGVIKGGSQF